MQKQLKDLFIPHDGNGYKPDILQRVSVGVILLLILLSFTLANLQALLWIASDWMVSTVLPSVLIELTNEERSHDALGTLAMSEKLNEAANLKAADMAKHEYFAHYSPDGVSPWYWFDQADYEFVHAGENLAVHFTDSEDVVKAWMDSPAHRANIMNGNYTEIGIGTAKGEYKGFPTVFVVQLFGTPAAPVTIAAAPSPEVLAVAEQPEEDIVTLETERTNTTQPDTVAPVTFETVPVDSDTATMTESSASTSEEVPQTEPLDVVVVYSDLATTSRDGIPAIVTPSDTQPPANGIRELIKRGAFVPSHWLQLFYTGMALFVTIALLLSIVIEWRRQHPVQIAYGTGLLAAMGALFYVHTVLTSGVTIV